MATRRSFRNITHDLLHSFVSRNNDVRGYWAMGKLCSHATINSMVVSIDLLRPGIDPPEEAFNSMLSLYRMKLLGLMQKAKLPESYIAGAYIHLKFFKNEVHLPGWSAQFRCSCTLEIIDDRNSRYSSVHVVLCNIS